jgi:carboxyl-terminal processing protease
MLLFLLACASLTDRQLADQALSGDLDGLAPLLARYDDPALEPWRADARAWQDLEPQSEALRRESRELMREAIESELAEGDLEGAASMLASAVPAWPEDTAFLMLADQLGRAAEQAGPEQAELAWKVMAELYAHEPGRMRDFQRKAAQAGIQGRYAPQQRAATARAQAGIGREGAVAVIAHLDREYLEEPDWASLAAHARQRMTWLAQAHGHEDPVASHAVHDAASALLALDQHVSALGSWGVPEEAVYAEWMAGVCESLDPWTRAVWPAEIQSWQDHHAGVTVGVGLELGEHEGMVFVERPLLDTPAWSSGIHQGDVLLSMTDATGSLDLSAPSPGQAALAQRGLYGDLGSWLRIEVAREGQRLAFEMQRAAVSMQTIEGYERGQDNAWSVWLAPRVAYVRITDFRASTEPDLDALLEPHLAAIEVVVLDLRGNPGGNVNAAVQVADRFVADGLLAGIDGRVLPDTGPEIDPETGERLADWNEALEGHALEGVPVIVLVDGDTASSAEVLAGALQERAGAWVIGSPTWGKGYAQALRGGEDDWALQLTNLVWTLPSGRRLDRQGGIQPDLLLPRTSPGERFRLAEQHDARTALRVHADGSPMVPVGPKAREGLPELGGDPALVAARLVARGLLVPPE